MSLFYFIFAILCLMLLLKEYGLFLSDFSSLLRDLGEYQFWVKIICIKTKIHVNFPYTTNTNIKFS